MGQNRDKRHQSKRRHPNRREDGGRRPKRDDGSQKTRGSARRDRPQAEVQRERPRHDRQERGSRPRSTSKSRDPWSTRADVDRVWMMPRDSDYAFVYWEVGESSVSAARAKLEQHDVKTQLVLRVRCSGRGHAAGEGARTLEIPIDGWIGERYVPLGPAGHEHFCTVGLRTLDTVQGLFVPLARSTPVISPQRVLAADA